LLAIKRGAFAVKLANESRLILNFTFGNCFVNSAANLSVSGNPVSSAITKVIGFLVNFVETDAALAAVGPAIKPTVSAETDPRAISLRR